MSYLGNSPGVASQRIVTTFTATAGQTTFTPSSGYALGYCDVFQNGVKLVAGDDYTASNGTTVVLSVGASAGDSVEVVAYIPRGLSDGYTKAEADALLALKQAALGYTPVNKAGDTITGALGLTSAAFSGSPQPLEFQHNTAPGNTFLKTAIYTNQNNTSGDANNGIFIEMGRLADAMSAEGRSFVVGFRGGQQSFRIDGYGRVTMPNQPAFLARGLSNANTSGGTSSNGILLFNEVMVNNGSNYSASTGRFTAPVGGNYFFTLNTLFDDSWSSSNGGVDVRRNGIRYFNLYYGIMSSGSYNMASASGVIFMNAGDYVDVQANLPGIHVGSDTSFSGHLIG